MSKVITFLKIKFEYIQTFESEKTKRFYIMLLEGLFYYALLIQYNGCDNTNLIYKYFQVIDKTNERFRDFIFDDNPEGNATTESPLRKIPLVSFPAYPLKS